MKNLRIQYSSKNMATHIINVYRASTRPQPSLFMPFQTIRFGRKELWLKICKKTYAIYHIFWLLSTGQRKTFSCEEYSQHTEEHISLRYRINISEQWNFDVNKEFSKYCSDTTILVFVLYPPTLHFSKSNSISMLALNTFMSLIIVQLGIIVQAGIFGQI